MACCIVEYPADIWDPSNIQQLEKLQRRAARWVLNDFHGPALNLDGKYQD